MAFTDLISRTEANSLIPQPLANEIIKMLPEYSAALQLFRSVSMGTKTLRMPVMQALPVATIGSGDTMLAPVTKAAWGNKELIAEPVKTMVVVPKAVINDSDFPMFDELKPVLAEAVGIALDQAVLFNIGKPVTWGTSLLEGAEAAGNVVVRGANQQNKGGIFKDITDLMFKVRSQGYRPNGFLADDLFEQYLLSATDTQGRPLVDITQAQTRLMGRPNAYSQPGIFPEGLDAAELFTGDFTKAIIGKREDILFTILKEGVVSDADGKVIHNLPQEGKIAILVEARFAFVVANPVTRATNGEDPALRFPFGVLKAPAA